MSEVPSVNDVKYKKLPDTEIAFLNFVSQLKVCCDV